MTKIEQAIDRLKQVEKACDDLLCMAEPDIKVLKARRDNARKVISLFDDFISRPSHDLDEMVELRAKRINDNLYGEINQVVCMGIGITIK